MLGPTSRDNLVTTSAPHGDKKALAYYFGTTEEPLGDHLNTTLDFAMKGGGRSIILTATAAMAGGTQLFEGVHLTSGNKCFCRKSSKCHNYASNTAYESY